MDDSEHEEILYRLDERTKRVDDHLNRLDRRLAEAEEELDHLDERVDENRNTLTILTKGAASIGTIITAGISGIFAKLFGLI